jgi:hypothetical protein
VDTAQARLAAEEAVRRYGLADDIDIIYDVTRLDNIASATGESGGEDADARVRAIVVGFRQVVNGLPMVSSDGGELRVTLDPAGNLIGVADTTRRVAELVDRGPGTTTPPTRPGASGTEPDQPAAAALLNAAVQRRLRQIASGGHVPEQVEVVPGTDEIGYALRETSAVLVARKTIEVDCGQGLRKRYDVEVPLAE